MRNPDTGQVRVSDVRVMHLFVNEVRVTHYTRKKAPGHTRDARTDPCDRETTESKADSTAAAPEPTSSWLCRVT